MKKNHLNVPTSDGDLVYCRKTESIDPFDASHMKLCAECPMFAGTIQGRGIECYWNDPRDIEEPYYVTDPAYELNSVEAAGVHDKKG